MSILEKIPATLPFAELRDRASLSPSMYRRTSIRSVNARPLKALLHPQTPFAVGVEPGSQAYAAKSTHYLMRTKALQPESALPYPKGDALQPINPKYFSGPAIKKDDVLVAKDSNIGEAAIVGAGDWSTHTISGGILRLNPQIDVHYLFACLKNEAFKEQLDALTPKGATIRHSGSLALECLIPFPAADRWFDERTRVVSVLCRLAVRAEELIRQRASQIFRVVDQELRSSQQHASVPSYQNPRFSEILGSGRLDAALYSEYYKSKAALLDGYRRGIVTPDEDGFTITPGPSLEIKIIKKRVDSEEPRPGYYALYLPKNISEYGDMVKVPYIGTPYRLPELRQGDVLFGEAGFRKGRSIVLLDPVCRTTTNAHGLYARRSHSDLKRAIFFRCIFDWYRQTGLIDLMAVGGSGGHLSPVYFHYVRIPSFPADIIDRIVDLYSRYPSGQWSLDAASDDFESEFAAVQDRMGLWQLSELKRRCWTELRSAVNALLEGEELDPRAALQRPAEWVAASALSLDPSEAADAVRGPIGCSP